MRKHRKVIRLIILLLLFVFLARPILFQSGSNAMDRNLRNTKTTKISFSPVISEYLNSLNTTTKENNECSSRYGRSLISTWKNENEIGCSPIHPGNPKETLIQCHFHLDKSKENICEARNLQINVQGVLSQSSLDATKATQGVFSGQCVKNSNVFQWDKFGHGAQEWLFRSFEDQETSLQCDEWIDHTIFFIGRWDPTNLFHAHEDKIQTFAAFLVTETDPSNTQVVLVDDVQLGPYMSFWDHVASSKNGLLSKEDIESRNAKTDSYNLKSLVQFYLKKNPHIKNICLRKAIFGVHAGISPLSREIGKPSGCSPPDTSLLLYYKRFVLEQLNLSQDEEWIPFKASKKEIKLSYVTRQGFTRAISNEDELLNQLSQLSSTMPEFSIEVYDFQNITFFQQIQIARDTDILLGGHGAAL